MSTFHDDTQGRGSSNSPPCPECSGLKASTVDSRPTGAGLIRRRKVCADCGHRYTTYEGVAGDIENAEAMRRNLEDVERGLIDLGTKLSAIRRQLMGAVVNVGGTIVE